MPLILAQTRLNGFKALNYHVKVRIFWLKNILLSIGLLKVY